MEQLHEFVFEVSQDRMTAQEAADHILEMDMEEGWLMKALKGPDVPITTTKPGGPRMGLFQQRGRTVKGTKSKYGTRIKGAGQPVYQIA